MMKGCGPARKALDRRHTAPFWSYPSGEVEYGAKLSSRFLRIREREESSRWQEGEAVP